MSSSFFIPKAAPPVRTSFVVDDGAGSDDDDVSGYVQLPEVVKTFLVYFRAQFDAKQDLQNIYEVHFGQLTERYFKASSWPPAETVAPFVDNDGVFLILYKNLYFRHVFAKLTPTNEQRVESWQNFVDLFDYLLSAENASDIDFDLPPQWLWDLVDDFVSQLQEFSYARVAAGAQRPIAADADTWSVQVAIRYLEKLASKAGVRPWSGAASASAGVDAFATHPLFSALGYFALVGLIQLHCSLNDFHLALCIASDIDATNKSSIARVLACHATLQYNIAFAHLMSRRQAECVRITQSVLLLIARTRHFHARVAQSDRLTSTAERLQALLALCSALFASHVDDSLRQSLRERHGDEISQLARDGNEAAFESLFMLASPALTLLAVDESAANAAPKTLQIATVVKQTRRSAARRASRLFVRNVGHAALLPTLRSFLKLYTTISIAKLALFLDVDDATCRTQLLAFKQQSRSLDAGARWTSASDVNFYIDGDMVHIIDTKQTSQFHYGEYFLKHIQRLERHADQLN